MNHLNLLTKLGKNILSLYHFMAPRYSSDTNNCDCLCKNRPCTHKNLISFFGPANIAILNSYPHTMSPMARLKWSAFLRGGFTAL